MKVGQFVWTIDIKKVDLGWRDSSVGGEFNLASRGTWDQIPEPM